jgi:SAM-dependent methyltransferase
MARATSSARAASVSRFDLYRACVQDPPKMVRFVEAVHGGRPRVLREDFCGPASLAVAWVRRSAGHRAIAVDRDPEPLAFARGRIGQVLEGGEARRVELVCADVRSRRLLTAARRADCVALFNFAVCELHDRRELVGYFRSLRASLRPGGVVVMDLYGGANAHSPGRATTRAKLDDGRPVAYTWRQEDADARSGIVRNAIDFKVGGRAFPRAFEYRWRLWTLPELRDALAEAGLRGLEVHDRLGVAQEAGGGLLARALGPDDRLDEDWVVYVVARRG